MESDTQYSDESLSDYDESNFDQMQNGYSSDEQEFRNQPSNLNLIQKNPEYNKYNIWLGQVSQMQRHRDWIVSFSESNIYEIHFTLYHRDKIRGIFTWSILPDNPYPEHPPIMKWIAPQIEFNKMIILMNFSLFNPKNWNPCQDLVSILDYLKTFLLNSKIINSENIVYNQLEKSIIRFSELTNLWPECSYDDTLPSFGVKKESSKLKKNNGKGYSKGTIEKFDFSKQQLIADEIYEILKSIYNTQILDDSQSNNLENLQILKEYQPLKIYINMSLMEVSFLEIHNNNKFYNLLIDISYWIYQNDTNLDYIELYTQIKKLANNIKNQNFDKSISIPLNQLEKKIIQFGDSIQKFDIKCYNINPLEDEYLSFLKGQKFKFSDNLSSTYFTGNKYQKLAQPKKVINRLKAEWSDLKSNLPVEHEGSIFINWSAEQFNLAKIMFIPSSTTPYAYGCYIFDLLITSDYPDNCPKLQFLTTGGGEVRFNPNLYNEGKVCLSLLGTWQGEGWTPGKSNLQQLLMSVLGMIFVEEPFFNEPCYNGKESIYQAQSQQYNLNIRYENLRIAIKDNINHPVPEFKDIMIHHFKCKFSMIKEKVNEWITDETNSSRKDNMRNYLSQIESLLF